MRRELQTIGRYVLYERIASGGMAQVHLGRLVGAAGFARTVAIKRLLPHCATDPEIGAMFVDEARLASRIRHQNVVSTLDVVQEKDELLIVMEYVAGDSLSRLLASARRRGERVPADVVSAIGIGILEGLHAAHEATNERGEPLAIIHRDVSPQNVMVSTDGVARVVDFGIAKAKGRIQTTRDGQLKGKASYIAPEQLEEREIDRRVDVYATSVVLWEMLARRKLFEASVEEAVFAAVLTQKVDPPSRFDPEIPSALEDIVMRGLSRDPDLRWATAREMATALERVQAPASARRVEEWLRDLAGDFLAARAAHVAAVENDEPSALASDVAPAQGKASDNEPTSPFSGTPSAGLSLDRERTSMRAPPAAGAIRMARWLALGVLLAVMAAFVVIRIGERTRPPPPPTAAAPPSSVIVVVPVAASAVVSPSIAPSSAPSNVPSAEPSPASSGSSPPVRHPPRISPTGRPRPSSTASPCAVPFTRAPDGTKIPKPECF